MLRLRLLRRLPAPPEALWPLLTDPTRMNTWSSAKVTLLADGDGGGGGGVGALRQLRLHALGRQARFEEVIVEATPPTRLVYRIVGGAPVRHHRGEILVERCPGGSTLRWDVEASFPLPLMEGLLRRVLVPELERSLDALALLAAKASAATGTASPSPAPGSSPPLDSSDPFDEAASLPSLRSAAEAILVEQRTLADELAAAGDCKQWFTRVYQFVTENQLAACASGELRHPAWVLRLVPRFHAYYVDNLRAARAPRDLSSPSVTQPAQQRIEPHWRSAFRAMEHAPRWRGNDFEGLMYGLAKGVQAHIEEDLPRALAAVYVEHYARRCDYARFRADYLLMGDIFRDAGSRLADSLPSLRRPLATRVLGALVEPLPAELRDRLLAGRFYDVARQRRKAFERGERIARLMLQGDGRRVAAPEKSGFSASRNSEGAQG